MKNNHNEAIAATEAFKLFAEQFDKNDPYKQIILEVLLEELLNYNKVKNIKE